MRAPAPLRAALLLLPLAVAAQAPQDRFLETIEVRVADVDVVVTDRDGNPLTDLTREDFELTEDGRPVEIRYFSRIVEGRLAPVDAAAENVETAPVVVDARAPLAWAIFVDQTNMRPAQRNEALRRLRAFFETGMAEGDRAIIATFDGVAFRVRGNFTDDRRAILAVLAGMEKERVIAGPAFREETRLRGEIERSVDFSDGQALGDQIFALIQSEAIRQANAIAAARSMVELMAGVEGRQAVVYVGTGFNTLPALGVTEVWRRRFPLLAGQLNAPRPEDEQVRLEQRITDLYERAAASRVAFYTIFAGERLDIGMNAEGPGGIDMDAAPIAGESSALGQAAALRELSDRTGGRTFRVNDDLSRQLATMASDLTHYYSLGYAPEKAGARPRKLTVKVRREGARVRYREALRERTMDERASDDVVASLFRGENANPLAISIHVDAPRRGSLGGPRLVPVTIKVPLASLAFFRDGEIHRGGVSVHVALASPEGTLWRLGSRELPLEIPHAELASALEKHVGYRVEVPLQSERIRIAVSVQDRFAPQIRSVITIPLDTRGGGR